MVSDERRTTPAPVPMSDEAEAAVLGAMLLTPKDVVDEIVSTLHISDFYRPKHQAVFAAIVKLYEDNAPIDAITVGEAMRSVGDLEQYGGLDMLLDLVVSVPVSAHGNYYSELIRHQGLRRALITTSAEIGSMAHAQEAEAYKVLDYAETAIMALGDARLRFEPERIGHGLSAVLQQFEAAANGTATQGLPTGFKDLDALTGGLRPGNLIIVAGRPSMGKSSLATAIALAGADTGTPVGIFSLEMDSDEVRQRVLCSRAQVSLHSARQGQLEDEGWAKLTAEAKNLSDLPLYVDPAPTSSPLELRAKCRRIKRSAGGLGLVVVDYLQLMTFPGYDTREREIAAISRSLKQLAVDLQVPVIAVSQLNRALESRGDKRPMLSDLRESGSLEADADLVMLLYRDDYYHRDSKKPGIAEVHIAKHRSGPVGRVELGFVDKWTLFRDLATDRHNGQVVEMM